MFIQIAEKRIMEKHHSENEMQRETFRGHLPPPFYSGKDEIGRIGYLAEPGLPHITSEDPSNYGVGGYYGNTYRQHHSHAILPDQVEGDRDTYRHLGDWRQPVDPDRSWHEERFRREGYRSMEERIESGQGHRGKGPRSYRRSDERILEDLNQRLHDDPWLDASDLEISSEGGEVTLTGTVPDKFSKRRAEDLAESIPGVTSVGNKLRIKA
jgi:hypothetical protein